MSWSVIQLYMLMVFKNRTKDIHLLLPTHFGSDICSVFPRGCRSVGGLLTRPGRVSPKWFPYDRTSHNDTHQCHYQTSQTEHSSFPSLPLFSVIISSILRYKFQFLFELDVFFYSTMCLQLHNSFSYFILNVLYSSSKYSLCMRTQMETSNQ